jgi:hypothetical protein
MKVIVGKASTGYLPKLPADGAPPMTSLKFKQCVLPAKHWAGGPLGEGESAHLMLSPYAALASKN